MAHSGGGSHASDVESLVNNSGGVSHSAVPVHVGNSTHGHGHAEERPCCVSVGYTIHICGPSPHTKSFPRGLHVGRDWPFLAGTYTIIVVCNLVAISWTALAAPGYALLLVAAFIECLLALSLVACSDPGIVRPHLNDIQPGIGVNYCGICMMHRRNGTLHCTRCGCCVEELDHHCPWTGKCIGKRNLCYFRFFVASVVINILAAGAVAAMRQLAVVHGA